MENNRGSDFNEAGDKVGRIHSLQQIFNYWEFNPLKFSEEDGKYGFEIQIDCLNLLLGEIFEFLDKKEIDDGKRRREELLEIDKERIFKKVLDNYKKIVHFYSTKYWKETREKIFEYNLFIKSLLGKYDLSMRKKEEDEEEYGYD